MKSDTHIVTFLPSGIAPNFEGLKVFLTSRIQKLYLALAAKFLNN